MAGCQLLKVMLAGMPQGVFSSWAASFLCRYCMICDSFLAKILLLISHLISIFALISNYLEKHL